MIINNKSHKNTLSSIILLALCCAPTFCGEAAKLPQTPVVSPEAGTELVKLARSTMISYLNERISKDDVYVPLTLQKILTAGSSGKKGSMPEYEVSLTLRSKGRIVSRTKGTGGKLTDNIITASLKAVRSRRLPDRVTAEFIKSTILEIEIIGPDADVDPIDIPGKLVPGRNGLKFSLGFAEDAGEGNPQRYITNRLLPSTIRMMGLDTSDSIRRACIVSSRHSTLLKNLTPDWMIFSTIHCIDYPDMGTHWLYYGKKVRTPEIIEKTNNSALARASIFLLKQFAPATGFVLPRVNNSITQPGSAEAQLHAAMAMKKASAHIDHKDIARSGSGTTILMARKYGAEEDGARYIFDKDRNRAIAPTAMFILAATTKPQNSDSKSTIQSMQKYLLDNISDDKKHFVRKDTKPTSVITTAKAIAAILASGHDDKNNIMGLMIQQLLEHGEKEGSLDPVAISWCIRGICAAKDVPKKKLAYYLPRLCRQLLDLQALSEIKVDEIGGFRQDGKITTEATGMAVTALSQALPLVKDTNIDSEKLKNAIKMGRQCLNWSIYMASEAYFAENPANFAGAVRHAPRYASIDMSASASLIEAFIED